MHAVRRTKRAYNGVPVDSSDYPYIVSLRNVNSQHMCGGTILTPQLILSAAQCFDPSLKPSPAKEVLVFSKSNNGDVYKLTHYMPHPDYRFEKPGMHDICIGVLESRIKNAVTVSLQPKPMKVAKHSLAQAFGWGKHEYGAVSEQLRRVDVAALMPSECKLELKTEWVCTDSSKGSICDGDSGGPLMFHGTQVGVATKNSESSQVQNPCLSGAPSVFTRVSTYYEWIQQWVTYYNNKFSQNN
ncbi:hypothetical protein QAD02_004495 [Eretmocerus hayati]|uniref:Uncharacterized protein n=1 Tax=Eretmocerus hayati TaxID=131215 RepID=A0ACC2NR00_9HYME|nr:hypothetical protein QAD02_004495 [Eretmocerus hayati]